MSWRRRESSWKKDSSVKDSSEGKKKFVGRRPDRQSSAIHFLFAVSGEPNKSHRLLLSASIHLVAGSTIFTNWRLVIGYLHSPQWSLTLNGSYDWRMASDYRPYDSAAT